MKDEKRVSKEEFENFIKSYPRHLQCLLVTVVEPCCVTYNDFSNGQTYPETSIVARTWLYSDNPNDWYYKPEKDREYYIRDEVYG